MIFYILQTDKWIKAMPVYIGVGFYTSSDFLFKQAESLGFRKHLALTKKKEIIEHLKHKFSLKSLYIATNFGLKPPVVIFDKIINSAEPYCSITLPIDLSVSKEFENLKEFAEPTHNIDPIVYCANESVEFS